MLLLFFGLWAVLFYIKSIPLKQRVLHLEGRCCSIACAGDEVGGVLDGGIGLHACQCGAGCGAVVIRACEGEEVIVLGIEFCHAVFTIRAAGIDDLHAIYASGEKADMVDIACLAEGVCLNDECALFHEEGEQFAFFHILDFGMGEIPLGG